MLALDDEEEELEERVDRGGGPPPRRRRWVEATEEEEQETDGEEKEGHSRGAVIGLNSSPSSSSSGCFVGVVSAVASEVAAVRVLAMGGNGGGCTGDGVGAECPRGLEQQGDAFPPSTSTIPVFFPCWATGCSFCSPVAAAAAEAH
ncbi:unnamed protein product, partial [Ectocarpus sp. 12 AP-2014]